MLLSQQAKIRLHIIHAESILQCAVQTGKTAIFRFGITLIPEPDIPLSDIEIPEEVVEEFLEEEIPLANVPKTGDVSALWMANDAIASV